MMIVSALRKTYRAHIYNSRTSMMTTPPTSRASNSQQRKSAVLRTPPDLVHRRAGLLFQVCKDQLLLPLRHVPSSPLDYYSRSVKTSFFYPCAMFQDQLLLPLRHVPSSPPGAGHSDEESALPVYHWDIFVSVLRSRLADSVAMVVFQSWDTVFAVREFLLPGIVPRFTEVRMESGLLSQIFSGMLGLGCVYIEVCACIYITLSTLRCELHECFVNTYVCI